MTKTFLWCGGKGRGGKDDFGNSLFVRGCRGRGGVQVGGAGRHQGLGAGDEPPKVRERPVIPVSVNYVPVVLRSMSEICRAFGVGCEQVRKWVAADAPIVVDRDEKGEITRYRAELNRLYLWQEARSKESPGSAGDSGY